MTAELTKTEMAGCKAIFETFEGETVSQPVFAEVEEDETPEEIDLQLRDAASRYAESKGYDFLRFEGNVTFNNPF